MAYCGTFIRVGDKEGVAILMYKKNQNSIGNIEYNIQNDNSSTSTARMKPE